MDHTAGPWEIGETDDISVDDQTTLWRVAIKAGLGEIAATYNTDLDQAMADARLSTHAPDMLGMIETLCNGLEWHIENNPTVMNESDAEALAEARDLLAKVKGK